MQVTQLIILLLPPATPVVIACLDFLALVIVKVMCQPSLSVQSCYGRVPLYRVSTTSLAK